MGEGEGRGRMGNSRERAVRKRRLLEEEIRGEREEGRKEGGGGW